MHLQSASGDSDFVPVEMAKCGKKDAELDTFLRNVDEVESIIKDLASNDTSATEKADEFLQRHQRNAQVAVGDSGSGVDRLVLLGRYNFRN